MSEAVQEQSVVDVEEWFLTQLESGDLDVDNLLEALNDQEVAGQRQKRQDLTELLDAALIERLDGPGMLKLALARVRWEGAACSRDCARSLKAAFKDRLGAACVECAFEGNPPIQESLRRLSILSGLGEGVYCFDKTWGFGIVKTIDDFYKKVTIDFDGKPGHQLSLAYAGGTLELINADHLLARRQNDRAELDRLVSEEPDEVVRIVLRSYGNMIVARLQEILTEQVFAAENWKSFWDRARKRLKSDPLVEIPAKRSEYIQLLDSEKAYDDAWFEALSQERDPVRILELAIELDVASSIKDLPPDHLAVLTERFRFAVRAAEGKQPDLEARLILKIVELGLADPAREYMSREELLRRYADAAAFVAAIGSIATRDAQRLMDLLEQHAPSTFQDLLFESMSAMPTPILTDTIKRLTGGELESRMIAYFGDAFFERRLGGTVLLYLCENLNCLDSWKMGSFPELLTQVIEELEAPGEGARLRQQKLLRALFDNVDWVQDVVARLTDRERELLFMRIRQSRGWDEASRRSVMAKMIKHFPELEQVAAKEGRKSEGKKLGRFTSWRTYRERQEQLRVLLEVSIPENSKEIGVARSYGDLRENFEYQAARDQQALLMRRKAEFERDLTVVRGSDFDGVAEDVAGMGTGVLFARADGTQQHYWILGEWDGDETLGIISNRSELAKRLTGARAGDAVVLPDDNPETPSKILGVTGLDAAVRQWMAGE